MRLRRALYVLFGIGSEYLIGQPFLLVRHCIVQLLEGRNQPLHPLSVFLGNLLIGLHVLYSVHRRVLLSALHECLVHLAGVLAHDLSELVPLRLLGRADSHLRMHLSDAAFDAPFRLFPRPRPASPPAPLPPCRPSAPPPPPP